MIRNYRIPALLHAAVLTAGLSLSAPLAATAATHHRSFVHRHPVATSLAAGAAAYHVARHSRRHGRGNFAQRHPVLTGVAAAGVTHHVLKHHR